VSVGMSLVMEKLFGSDVFLHVPVSATAQPRFRLFQISSSVSEIHQILDSPKLI